MSNRYDLVIYDCDGTLYDTFPGITADLILTLDEMNCAPMPENYDWRPCVGPPLDDIFGTLLGVPADRVAEACAIYRRNYASIVIPNCVLFDGVADSLNELAAAGVELGIASSKNQRSLNQTMEKDGLAPMFSCILGPTAEMPLSKTELIINASSITGVSVDRILMVGDTRFDAIGAAEAGIDFAAALWGYGGENEFDGLPCVIRASCAQEVAAFVRHTCS